MKKSLWTGLLTLAVVGATAMPVLAGAGGGGAGGGGGGGGRRGGGAGGGGAGGGGAGGGGGGGRGGGGGFAPDPAAILAARLTAIKGQLNATDQEWTILSDKLSKVLTLQTELNVGRQNGGFGGGGRGGRGGGAGGAPAGPTPLPTITVDQANAVSVTADALNKKAADATADLKPELAALRDARAKKAADLKKAQDDLKGVVTVRQEAILVSLGILD